jgi:UDP-GlcNAc:undecaprenyl-phosphate GlcNAc-1-phosphate transferase
MSPALRVAFLAALATLGLVLVLSRWLGPRGWMDHPSERKQHGRPVPRVGGLALLGLLGLAKLGGWLDLHLSPLEWAAVVGMALTGALDDRLDLRPRWKALAGLGFALPLAWVHSTWLLQSGLDVTLFGVDIPDHGALFFPLLIMWYWGVPQAYNLIDGINGLSLGFGLLLLGALSLGPQAQLGAAAAPLWGGLAGLLLLNYPRARHFLGDSGSLLLGTLFAILVMNRALPHHRGLALWLTAYPVLDVTTVVAIRWVAGRPLGQADRSHLHHWFTDLLGGRAWLACPLLLGLAALPMTRDLPWTWGKSVSLLGLGALVLLFLASFLDRAIRRTAPAARLDLEPAPVEVLRPFAPEPTGPNRVA